ncbi:DUF805 domain-containing protein [Insolitispirillum peregrinum]
MGLSNYFRSFLCENYSNFSGRASRGEFSCIAVAFILMNLFMAFIDYHNGGQYYRDIYIDIKFMIYKAYDILNIILIFPVSSLIVRRIHDLDLSGWVFVFYVFSVFVLYFCFDVYLYALLIFIISSNLLIILMVVRGTVGSNRFGQDPLGCGLGDDVKMGGVEM